MRGHIARMLGGAVGVHRVLSAADELPLVPLDELGLVESGMLMDQDHGLMGVGVQASLLLLNR